MSDPARSPSLVSLRGLVMREPLASLAALTSPPQAAEPTMNEIPSCLAIIRASRSARLERLVPKGGPNPFVAGSEREIAGPNVRLVGEADHALWPLFTWPEWKTPTGARWNFGRVIPGQAGPPGTAKVIPLNWNSQAVTYALP